MCSRYASPLPPSAAALVKNLEKEPICRSVLQGGDGPERACTFEHPLELTASLAEEISKEKMISTDKWSLRNISLDVRRTVSLETGAKFPSSALLMIRSATDGSQRWGPDDSCSACR
jgi:hypothetical protein